MTIENRQISGKYIFHLIFYLLLYVSVLYIDLDGTCVVYVYTDVACT